MQIKKIIYSVLLLIFSIKGAAEDSITQANYFKEAIAENNLDKILALIKAGHDINSQDDQGKTALHWATSLGKPEIVSALLKNKDLDPNIFDDDGKTPLIVAIENDYLEIISLLCDSETTNLESRTSEAVKTPLMLAATLQPKPNKEIVKILLDNGANPFAELTNGKGIEDSIWSILKWDDYRGEIGKTISENIELCEKRGHETYSETLFNKKSLEDVIGMHKKGRWIIDTNTMQLMLNECITRFYSRWVKLLLDNKANPNEYYRRDRAVNISIQFVCQWNSRKADNLALLLAYGGNISSVENERQDDFLENIKFLYKSNITNNGAPANPSDELVLSISPLQWAVICFNDIDIIKHHLARNSDLSWTNRENETATMLAKKLHFNDGLELLLQSQNKFGEKIFRITKLNRPLTNIIKEYLFGIIK